MNVFTHVVAFAGGMIVGAALLLGVQYAGSALAALFAPRPGGH